MTVKVTPEMAAAAREWFSRVSYIEPVDLAEEPVYDDDDETGTVTGGLTALAESLREIEPGTTEFDVAVQDAQQQLLGMLDSSADQVTSDTLNEVVDALETLLGVNWTDTGDTETAPGFAEGSTEMAQTKPTTRKAVDRALIEDFAKSLTSLTAAADGGCLPCQERAMAAAARAAETDPRWEGVIGVEGQMTGDGRFIEVGALRWADLPIPIRYVSQDVGAHDGAQVVGLIDSIERRDVADQPDVKVIWGTGIFDLGSEVAREAMRVVDKKTSNGVSMDLDDVTFEVRVASELDPEIVELSDGSQGVGLNDGIGISEDADAAGRRTVTKVAPTDEVTVTVDGRIRASTIVAIPAFADAKISLVLDDEGGASLAASAFNWVEDVGGLPLYVNRIKKHLIRKGMTESHAIATAVNVVKKMCATGDVNFPGKQDVNPGSRAEACLAVADWERKKAQARADAAETATFAPPKEPQRGDSGWDEDEHPRGVGGMWIDKEDETSIEENLKMLGYLEPGMSMTDAVKAWQKAQGLPETGELDEDQVTRLARPREHTDKTKADAKKREAARQDKAKGEGGGGSGGGGGGKDDAGGGGGGGESAAAKKRKAAAEKKRTEAADKREIAAKATQQKRVDTAQGRADVARTKLEGIQKIAEAAAAAAESARIRAEDARAKADAAGGGETTPKAIQAEADYERAKRAAEAVAPRVVEAQARYDELAELLRVAQERLGKLSAALAFVQRLTSMTRMSFTADTEEFAYNPLQWRNPANGQWIDMPGSIGRSLSDWLNAQDSPNKEYLPLVADIRERSDQLNKLDLSTSEGAARYFRQADEMFQPAEDLNNIAELDDDQGMMEQSRDLLESLENVLKLGEDQFVNEIELMFIENAGGPIRSDSPQVPSDTETSLDLTELTEQELYDEAERIWKQLIAGKDVREDYERMEEEKTRRNIGYPWISPDDREADRIKGATANEKAREARETPEQLLEQLDREEVVDVALKNTPAELRPIAERYLKGKIVRDEALIELQEAMGGEPAPTAVPTGEAPTSKPVTELTDAELQAEWDAYFAQTPEEAALLDDAAVEEQYARWQEVFKETDRRLTARVQARLDAANTGPGGYLEDPAVRADSERIQAQGEAPALGTEVSEMADDDLLDEIDRLIAGLSGGVLTDPAEADRLDDLLAEAETRGLTGSDLTEERAAPELGQPLSAELLADFAGGSAEPFLVDGRFNAERTALHEQIVAKILSGVTPPEGRPPSFNMLGGGPASGKSFFVKQNPQLVENAALINPDDIKLELPEYLAMQNSGTGEQSAGFVHEESSYLAKLAQERAILAGVDITLDGTGDSSIRKLSTKLDAARAKGYSVQGYYVSADVDVALRRAEDRATRTGRHVLPTVIRETHRNVSLVLPEVVDYFDTLQVVDTSQDGVMALLASKESGKPLVIADEALWQRFLDKGKG